MAKTDVLQACVRVANALKRGRGLHAPGRVQRLTDGRPGSSDDARSPLHWRCPVTRRFVNVNKDGR